MSTRPVNTYSIVAHDPDTGQLGVAVQSHYFCVGSVVPWAEAGVGAVATQSFAEISYGPLGLALMRAGKTPRQALDALIAADTQPQTRQVGMVDAKGNTAVHTGTRCTLEAGHREGKGYTVQANLMLNDTVWDAMAEAFEGTRDDLAGRLLAALFAAEAAGGDIRGKQSAALLVVGGERTGNGWGDRVFDLRVDDNPAPLDEMQRLLRIARAYKHEDAAEAALTEASTDPSRIDFAMSEFNRAVELMPDIDSNPEILFWYAVSLAKGGKIEEALPLFRRIFAFNDAWRTLVPRMAQSDLLPNDQGLIDRITGA